MSTRRKILGELNIKKKCKTFLLPMLEMSLMHISREIDHLIDIGFTLTGFPQIVYIFDNVDYEPLLMDIYKLQNHHCYVDAEFADDNKEIIIYLDVPKEFRKDFELFIQGKYTEFSKEYKNILIKNYGVGRQKGVNDKNGLPNISVYDVIYPSEDNKTNLANTLSVNGSKIDWKDIKEIIDPPNIEVEQFKKIEELIEEYDRRGENISNLEQI